MSGLTCYLAGMLPKFEVKEYDGRFFVHTNWGIPNTTLQYPGVYDTLQVTTSGRLDTASSGWSTKEKAEAAIEQCKARLR